MLIGKPNFITFLIALGGGAFAIAIKLGIIPLAALAGFSFWILAAAFVLLILGCLIPGL